MPTVEPLPKRRQASGPRRVNGTILSSSKHCLSGASSGRPNVCIGANLGFSVVDPVPDRSGSIKAKKSLDDYQDVIFSLLSCPAPAAEYAVAR